MRLNRSRMFSILFAFCIAMAVGSSAQTLTTLVNFDFNNGAEPLYESLVQGPDGNFYGTTNGAGAHNGGIVFQMTPSGTVTVLYSFLCPAQLYRWQRSGCRACARQRWQLLRGNHVRRRQ